MVEDSNLWRDINFLLLLKISLVFNGIADGVHVDSWQDWSRSPSIVCFLMESIRVLDGAYLEHRGILWDHIMALTLREVHVESMWTPEGIPVDSMEDPWNLFGLLMESNRMCGSVSLTPPILGKALGETNLGGLS
jgi:hypothetical protein